MAIDLRAVRAELRNIRSNVEDTEAGVRLLRAFGGDAEERRYLKQLRQTKAARELLVERPDLLGALANRDQLRRLPKGSLGREYLAFVERENLCPQALDELLQRLSHDTADRDITFLKARGHALHDLLHVLTGYGRDSAGEIALLAFTGIQDGHRQAVWLSRLGFMMAAVMFRFELLKLIRQARRRARQSPWMFAQDWLPLLGRPIDEVRKELGLWPTPQYRP